MSGTVQPLACPSPYNLFQTDRECLSENFSEIIIEFPGN